MKTKRDAFREEERLAFPYAIEFVKFVVVFSCVIAVALVTLSFVSTTVG